MPKITYYYSRCLNDSDVYSIREKTMRDAQIRLNSYGGRANRFGPIVKVIVEFNNIHDLLFRALDEGGLYEEGESYRTKSKE